METLNKNLVEKLDRPIKIIQMGEGNFLRGFCDTFINRLNYKTDFCGNVCLVQPRDSHKISKFWDQDCLYTSITEGLDNNELVSFSEVIDCIGDAIDPYENYDSYLKYATSPDLKVFISNTTESGIYLEQEDTNLDITPKSFPGKLLAFLHKRFVHFDGDKNYGLYIIPCELITNNGDTLKNVLVDLAKLNNLSSEFIDWLTGANKFYNTLVDRIIPGFPKDDINKWQEKWGYVDNLCVKGEAYHLWCLQGDKSLFDVLPFDKIDKNIILCDDISPYKERKVKILNGSHTFLVPTVYQLGFRVVNKTIEDQNVRILLDNFINNEVLPSIDLPRDEIIQFKNDVLERFANPTIQHEWTSIMLNSMSKYKERILPVVKHYYKVNNKPPKYALFGLASLLNLYKINVTEKIFEDDAEFLSMYKKLFDGNHTNEEIIEQVLSLDYWGFDFINAPGAFEYVLNCFNKIEDEGIEAAYSSLIETR